MNIIELVKQAGNGKVRSPGDCHMLYPDELKRFAYLIRAQTLEEAVRVCERAAGKSGLGVKYQGEVFAAAIQQLKENHEKIY
jgi:hypothetical protein